MAKPVTVIHSGSVTHIVPVWWTEGRLTSGTCIYEAVISSGFEEFPERTQGKSRNLNIHHQVGNVQYIPFGMSNSRDIKAWATLNENAPSVVEEDCGEMRRAFYVLIKVSSLSPDFNILSDGCRGCSRENSVNLRRNRLHFYMYMFPHISTTL